MIKHHPTSAVLESFVRGELPASVSVIVASHIEMCEQCRAHVNLSTIEAANQVFSGYIEDSGNKELTESGDVLEIDEVQFNNEFDQKHSFTQFPNDELSASDLNLIDRITALPEQEENNLVNTVREIELGKQRVPLPKALKSIELKEWQKLGKLVRSRLALEDDNLRTSLLYIDKGGNIPTHTHKGFEITLLIQGSFEDELGSYSKGDIVFLDGMHTHNPKTKEGCVCLTVSSDAIHFTQGVSQLFNPIGRFIY